MSDELNDGQEQVEEENNPLLRERPATNASQSNTTPSSEPTTDLAQDLEQVDAGGNLPNVRLSGNHNPVTVNGIVNIGMEKAIELPDEETQRKGFYVEDFVALTTQYQGIYKPITRKERVSGNTEGQE